MSSIKLLFARPLEGQGLLESVSAVHDRRASLCVIGVDGAELPSDFGEVIEAVTTSTDPLAGPSTHLFVTGAAGHHPSDAEQSHPMGVTRSNLCPPRFLMPAVVTASIRARVG